MKSPDLAARGSGSHAVVLVHGVLGQGFLYWNRIKQYLEGDRNHFHEVRLPFFGFGDLRKAAAHLSQEVDEILKECATDTGEDKVDLIAHSAGGLVARYFVKRLGGDRRVHSLITLGTPHFGTYTSYFAPLNKVARQTLPGSPFLKDLNRGSETSGPLHLVSIYSQTDGVVMPPANAILPGAHNIEVPWLTHWGFLWDTRVYRHIREAINHDAGDYPFYSGKTVRRGGPSRRSHARK